MKSRALVVASLLFFSGMCALIYQVVWFREFRLVFGASHPASAAVLAIFMGGLGLGNYLLGKRVDNHPNPLALYANLELAISLVCALTPWLTDLMRGLYVGLGGQMAMGEFGATLARLLLAMLVLGVPTILMGGTLPAAVRSVLKTDDLQRRDVGLLYGFNTLGAVAGSVISTFFMLELLGTRTTLWSAALANLLISLTARTLARRAAAEHASTKRNASVEAPQAASASSGGAAPAWLVYAGAGIVGFAFFLMELVWYRMLGPILGGTTFTFGLILAVALTGIGLGGALYPLLYRNRQVTLAGFALTCSLEGAFIALPYALGDRLAVLTVVLRNMSVFGFYGELLAWTIVCAIVVLPAAVVAGVQFPLLIALVGRSDRHVGKQVGLAFGWNTVGAILGAIAGGFGLLPGLGATGTWVAVVWLLVALGGISLLVSLSTERRPATVAWCTATLVLALAGSMSTGPTAAWRHSSIGAGRAGLNDWSINGMRDWMHKHRRNIIWEADGVETSVALNVENGVAFYVNGKSDGNAIYDGPTQVMSGLLGGLLHGAPKTALVVGLGTGETTGWLADVKSIQRVDVVELEPAVDEMARRCSSINRNVLSHPKVNRIYTDAREVLLTTPERYDLIVSEPSNPYRAGVATLYTRECYQAALNRLNPGGVYGQFLQGYEVSVETVRTVLATLRSVFSHVEVWETRTNDMFLVGSAEPLVLRIDEMRRLIQEEPYRTALLQTWLVTDLEGVLAHFVAGKGLVEAVAAYEQNSLNSDDKNQIEYGFARTVGMRTNFSSVMLHQAARDYNAHRPQVQSGAVDWTLVEDHRVSTFAVTDGLVPMPPGADAEQAARGQAWESYVRSNFTLCIDRWAQQKRGPIGYAETMMLAQANADRGTAEAESLIEKMAAMDPLSAHAIRAVYHFKQNRLAQTISELEKLMIGLRTNPWPPYRSIAVAVNLPLSIVQAHPDYAPRLHAVLKEPFALWILEDMRRNADFAVAQRIGPAAVVESLKPYEPHVVWNGPFLAARYNAYEATQHPLAGRAKRDLDEFLRFAPRELFLPQRE